MGSLLSRGYARDAVGRIKTIVGGAIGAAAAIGMGIYELCRDKPCPPCTTVSGKIVPIGTIGYRPLDTPDRPQHGIDGPHHNLYKANQNPKNCQCFWQSIGAKKPSEVPAGAMPIEPFLSLPR